MGGYLSSSGRQQPTLEGGIPPSERRVLIVLDSAQDAQKVFNFWANARGSQNDELILFTSVEVPNALTGLLLSPSGTYEHEEHEKQASLVLKRAKVLKRTMLAQCRQRGLRCSFISEGGSPGAAIVEAANKIDANVVVVGCRGNNGIRRTLLGSVSDYVLQYAARPVVVVPTKAD